MKQILTNRIITAFLVLITFTALISCGKTTLNAELNRSFRMTADQNVKIDKTDLVLDGFVVTEDSRCPKDAICFWEGQVVAEFDLDGSLLVFNSFKTLDTLGYTFQIKSVEPIKEDGVEIPLSNYILEILVTK